MSPHRSVSSRQNAFYAARRSLFLLSLRPILSNALCATLIFAAGLCHAQSNLVLRAGGITLEADRQSGVILRVHDASLGITLAPPPG